MSISSYQIKLLKLISWLSIIRLPNIFILICAQYLSSIYILSPNNSKIDVALDFFLFLIILSTVCSVISGYIINDFYDKKKDLINKPIKSQLNNLSRQQHKFTIYFLLNLIAITAASAISFKACLFFSSYIFGIWIYSFFIKRLVFIGNIVSSLLMITPFFAVFLYFKNFELLIFAYAIFLFLIMLSRELVKDLENINGDYTNKYYTIPVVYGEKTAKWVLSISLLLTFCAELYLISLFNISPMRFYFYFCSALTLSAFFLIFRAKTKLNYIILHYSFKLIIMLGVFSILLYKVP